jgi:hypothetical protein
LHDGNVRWRRRAVSDGNPRSPARSPTCRDCAFLPVVRFRCLCRDRCRLSVTPSARRCVFDWWRVARHERSCRGDSAVDRWASGRGVRESYPGPANSYPTIGSIAKKRRVGRFQNDLAGSKPPGFIGATSFQIEVVPRLSDLPGYEDWYLLDGTWAMDPLNAFAISGHVQAPHDSVAAMMEQ